VNVKNTNNKMLFVVASFFCVSIAMAVTVGPNFFGYSKPFFGGQVLLISKANCVVPAKGVEEKLLETHEATSQNARSQNWYKSEGIRNTAACLDVGLKL
jgi:hypothetical protein